MFFWGVLQSQLCLNIEIEHKFFFFKSANLNKQNVNGV